MLYTKIRPNMEHESQNSYHKSNYGFPYFEIEGIEGDRVLGGIGGNYAINTLAFYMRDGDDFIFIGNAPKKMKVVSYG